MLDKLFFAWDRPYDSDSGRRGFNSLGAIYQEYIAYVNYSMWIFQLEPRVSLCWLV